MMRGHVAVKTSRFHPVKARRGDPFSFRVRHCDPIAWADSHPVWISKSGGNHIKFAAVPVYPEEGSAVNSSRGTTEVIKIPIGIGVETGCVAVSARVDLRVIVEIDVMIRLAVVV